MTEVVKKLVVKSAVRVVALDRLNVDESYQREVKKGHKAIVADFKKEAFGIPLVGERGDGSLWIVDGLQRTTALKKLGKKDVRAEVFASKGSEHEADVFKTINLARVKLNPSEAFKALLTAHDALAWKIKDACDAEGFQVVTGKSARDHLAANSLTCVKTMLVIAGRSGVAPIRFALSMIKQAWPDDRMGTHAGIVSGLAKFWLRREQVVDVGRLLPRLRTVTPHKVLYTAGQLTLSNNLTDSVDTVIEKLYLKRLSRK